MIDEGNFDQANIYDSMYNSKTVAYFSSLTHPGYLLITWQAYIVL